MYVYVCMQACACACFPSLWYALTIATVFTEDHGIIPGYHQGVRSIQLIKINQFNQLKLMIKINRFNQ